MAAVFYTIIKNDDQVKKLYLGKIFKPDGYSFNIYYRDIYTNTSTLWKTKWEKPEHESYSIPYLIVEFIKIRPVEEIHFFVLRTKKLLVIGKRRLLSNIKRGIFQHEVINHVDQYLIPTTFFEEKIKEYSIPWTNNEVSLNKLERMFLRQKNPPASVLSTSQRV